MKTKEAISRLTYTISKGNKPNETDKVALNSLITFINNSDTQTIQDNALFAKLYTFVLSQFLSHYEDIDFANQQLNKELSTPINYHIQFLQMNLQTFEIQNFFKSKGIIDPFIIGKPMEEAIQKYKDNQKLFPKINAREFLEVTDMWDYDNVVAHLNRNINESLTAYKNV